MAENLIAVFGQDQSTAAPWARLVGSKNGILVEEAFSQVPEANFFSLFPTPRSDFELGEHPDGGLLSFAIVGASGDRRLQSRRMQFDTKGVFVVDANPMEVPIPNYTSIEVMKDYVYLHVLNDTTNSQGQGYQIRDIRTLELVASGNHIILDLGGYATAYNFPAATVRNTLYFNCRKSADAYEWPHGVRFDHNAGGARSDFDLPGYSLATPTTTYKTLAEGWGTMRTRNGSTSVGMSQSAPWQIHTTSTGSNNHTYDRRHGALDEYGTLVVLEAGFQPSPAFDAKPSKGVIQPYPNTIRQVSFTPHDEAAFGDVVTCSWQETRQASSSHPQPFSWHAVAGAFDLPPIGVGGLITVPFTHSLVQPASMAEFPGDGYEWPILTGGSQNRGVSSGELMAHVQESANDAGTHAEIGYSTTPGNWETLAWSWELSTTDPIVMRYTPMPVIEYVDDGVRRIFW